MKQFEIRIFSPKDIKKRAFVSITINGKRYREYNGNKIGSPIKPNLSKTVKERNRLLKQLEFEYRKALETGEYQQAINPLITPRTLADLLVCAIEQKASSNLTPKYVKAISTTYQDFTSFLSTEELHNVVGNLKTDRVQAYLNQFRATPTFYMHRRKELASLFNTGSKMLGLDYNPVINSERIKTKAKLHKIYSKNQLKKVFEFLKNRNENLYLCCLISYGCFLRPHIEVRNLKGKHFKANYSEIHLSGEENKSGRIRVTFVPQYVKDELHQRVSTLQYNENLFSRTQESFNEYYFKTAWTREFKHMLKLGIIERDQTMYSFRHTAAVEVYNNTKDLHILQELLGHSDMIVTLKYLRGLGVTDKEKLKHVMPTL